MVYEFQGYISQCGEKWKKIGVTKRKCIQAKIKITKGVEITKGMVKVLGDDPKYWDYLREFTVKIYEQGQTDKFDPSKQIGFECKLDSMKIVKKGDKITLSSYSREEGKHREKLIEAVIDITLETQDEDFEYRKSYFAILERSNIKQSQLKMGEEKNDDS